LISWFKIERQDPREGREGGRERGRARGRQRKRINSNQRGEKTHAAAFVFL